jgi:hypothetical protein
MAMMNSTRAILLFVLGTCLYQLSLTEEGTVPCIGISRC